MYSVALFVAIILADDPAPFISQPLEDKFAADVTKATAGVTEAQVELAKARKAAAEFRLKGYKDKLVEFTKAGDFDKAVAVKARIQELEINPDNTEPVRPTKRPRPKETARFDGHAYALISEPATWHVAKQRCEEMGGKLVCVNNLKESAFVAKLCGTSLCWIGATDEEDEGKWSNIDGTSMNLPTPVLDNAGGLEHCMSFDGQSSHRFNDLDGSGRAPYICEWSR